MPNTALLDALPQNSETAVVNLPTFFPAQAKLRWLMSRSRFVVARCGRRWGKNVVGETVASDDAAHGLRVGWFAPENKRLSESYNVIVEALDPVKKRSDKTHGMIETITGGRVEFWSMEDENAGRSRKYHRVIGDEIAFTKPKSINIWTRSILPTLIDYRGRALMMSNTNGIDPDNMLFALCHEAAYGFVQFHAPNYTNPYLPREELEERRRNSLPLVYEQEDLANFVDWSGNAFFTRDKLLVNGEPVSDPVRCEAVYAIIDSAVKTGKKNDGTGMAIFAVVRNPVRPVTADGQIGPQYSLVILDWDLIQIEGASLELWLPGVFNLLEDYARTCRARMGSLGAFIEDKASGMILLQQAAKKYPGKAHAIDSKLTALGKDERAISVSDYHYRGLCKISKRAFDKTTTFKGSTRNHYLGQIVGFRVGDKDATREDDLLDCHCYGLAVALGNAKGF